MSAVIRVAGGRFEGGEGEEEEGKSDEGAVVEVRQRGLRGAAKEGLA